jgi:hypothetical protein
MLTTYKELISVWILGMSQTPPVVTTGIETGNASFCSLGTLSLVLYLIYYQIPRQDRVASFGTCLG